MISQSEYAFHTLMEHQNQKIARLQEEQESNSTTIRELQARNHHIALELQQLHEKFDIAQKALALENERVRELDLNPGPTPGEPNGTKAGSEDPNTPDGTQAGGNEDPNVPEGLQTSRETPNVPEDPDGSQADTPADERQPAYPDRLISQECRQQTTHQLRQEPKDQLEVLEFIAQQADGYINIREAENIMVDSYTITSNNPAYRRARIMKLLKSTANPPWLDTDHPDVFKMPGNDIVPTSDPDQDPAQEQNPAPDQDQDLAPNQDPAQEQNPAPDQDPLVQALRSQALAQDRTISTSETAPQMQALDLIPQDSPDPEGHIYQSLANHPDWEQTGADTFRMNTKHP